MVENAWTIGINVLSHDIAARGDSPRKAKGRAGEINRRKLALAPQITMDPTGGVVLSHNIAARVDPHGRVEGRAREVNPGEGGARSKNVRCSAQREAKREQVKAPLSSHMFLSIPGR